MTEVKLAIAGELRSGKLR
ncbi:hypothetical protein QCM8_32 [Bacillus phage QCM8]|nr:hypothetical protein QCM8_32 [Bacillus phage QCM8]